MVKNDMIKLLGIIKSVKDCEKKLTEFSNKRNGKLIALDIGSLEYSLYKEWAILLSNLVDDIEKAKYLFDDALYIKMENYFDSEVKIDNKYSDIVNEIEWKLYNNKKRGKITIRLLLDAFRNKKTHSIKNNKEAEYKLFSLAINEIILIELFNLCSNLINERTNRLTSEELSDYLKLNSDIIISFYKIQEYFSSPIYKEVIENLDSNAFKQKKDNYNQFINSKLNEYNIVLEQLEKK